MLKIRNVITIGFLSSCGLIVCFWPQRNWSDWSLEQEIEWCLLWKALRQRYVGTRQWACFKTETTVTTLPKGANCESSWCSRKNYSVELPRIHKHGGSPPLFVRYALTAKYTHPNVNIMQNAFVIQCPHLQKWMNRRVGVCVCVLMYLRVCCTNNTTLAHLSYWSKGSDINLRQVKLVKIQTIILSSSYLDKKGFHFCHHDCLISSC